MAGEGDQLCFEKPEDVTNGVITCKPDMKYCVSVRQELLDPKNQVVSISRTCAVSPTNKNEVIEDSTYRFYFVACQEDTCNGGSGKDTSGNSGAQGDTGGVGTLLVSGIRTGGANNLVSFSIIFMFGLSLFMNIL